MSALDKILKCLLRTETLNISTHFFSQPRPLNPSSYGASASLGALTAPWLPSTSQAPSALLMAAPSSKQRTSHTAMPGLCLSRSLCVACCSGPAHTGPTFWLLQPLFNRYLFSPGHNDVWSPGASAELWFLSVMPWYILLTFIVVLWSFWSVLSYSTFGQHITIY